MPPAYRTADEFVLAHVSFRSKLKVQGQTALLRVTIHEGRNRQIRRLCERAGLRCTRLRRIAEGPLQLGDLKPGQYRLLTDAELSALRREFERNT